MGRAFLQSKVAAGDCVGMVYLGLKEAFYRIIGQLGPITDALLGKVCARLQLP